MLIGGLIVLLFVDIFTFDVVHPQVGIDPTQPILGMAVEQVCNAGGGTYEKWADPSVSCTGFSRPDPG